jgi:hypothetical protein
LIQVAGKAAEGWRSPRREAFTDDTRTARSVLECASPLALWEGGCDAWGGAELFHLCDDEDFHFIILPAVWQSCFQSHILRANQCRQSGGNLFYPREIDVECRQFQIEW